MFQRIIVTWLHLRTPVEFKGSERVFFLFIYLFLGFHGVFQLGFNAENVKVNGQLIMHVLVYNSKVLFAFLEDAFE